MLQKRRQSVQAPSTSRWNSPRLITQMYFEGDPLIPQDPIVQTIPDKRALEQLIAPVDLNATIPLDSIISGQRVVSVARARRIRALTLTCGHCDGSGDFAYRVGLPGKSGVDGGILAVAPGRASIAVWSPGLNAGGNSLLGSLALERLARRTGWSVFGPKRA